MNEGVDKIQFIAISTTHSHTLLIWEKNEIVIQNNLNSPGDLEGLALSWPELSSLNKVNSNHGKLSLFFF